MLLVAPAAPGALPAARPAGPASGPATGRCRPAIRRSTATAWTTTTTGPRPPGFAAQRAHHHDPSRLSLASGSEIVIDFVEDAIRVTQVFLLRNDGPPSIPGARPRLPAPRQRRRGQRAPARSPPRRGRQARGHLAGPRRAGRVAPVAIQYAVTYKPTPRSSSRSPALRRAAGRHRPTGLRVAVAGYQQRDEVDTPQGGRFTVHRMGNLAPGATVSISLSHRARFSGSRASWSSVSSAGCSSAPTLRAPRRRSSSSSRRGASGCSTTCRHRAPAAPGQGAVAQSCSRSARSSSGSSSRCTAISTSAARSYTEAVTAVPRAPRPSPVVLDRVTRSTAGSGRSPG